MRLKHFSVILSLFSAFVAVSPSQGATTYEWTFNKGNLDGAIGNGILTAADASTAAQISYASTDGTLIPHINGQIAQILKVPSLTSTTSGLLLTFPSSGPNGGGSYINNYTLVMDLYSPGTGGWQALFNTATSNSNDADFYINPSGQLGIAALGYGTAATIAQNQWNRIAFVADLENGTVKYFINGTLAFTRSGASLVDGRFSLFSNANAGADLLLFNEGDSSGVYTHPLYLNSIAFTDTALSDAAIAALGGAKATGILVPEPSNSLLAILSCAGFLTRRRRK